MPAAWYTASSPLDDQRVVEQLDFEVVLVDAGEIHGDLERRACFGHVRGGTPAGLQQQAQALVLPRSAEGPRLAADAQACRAVGQASVTHVRFRVPSIVPAGFGLSIEWRVKHRQNSVSIWTPRGSDQPTITPPLRCGMAPALHSLRCMSLLQTRPLEGVEVSVVSEVPDLVEPVRTTLRICGADTVTAAASCRQLMQQREGRRADAIIVDSLTKDLDVRFSRGPTT